MSLRELNDGWERQFIEARFTRRLQERLMAEHTERLRREINQRIFESVVVSVLDSKGRIRGLGLNEPKDLILDNFGAWLAGLIRAPVATAWKSCSMVDNGGIARTVYLYYFLGVFNAHETRSLGTNIRVGSGATPPARSDYAIETPFETPPENAVFPTGDGSYAAGAISFSGSITAGGSGTIREVGFYGHWIDVDQITRDFMLFHDLVSAVGFTAGQAITVAYTINL